jgi:hypothetical protein
MCRVQQQPSMYSDNTPEQHFTQHIHGEEFHFMKVCLFAVQVLFKMLNRGIFSEILGCEPHCCAVAVQDAEPRHLQ